MISFFSQLVAIIRNTFLESIRQPVFAVIVGGTVLLLIMNPMLSSYTFEDDDKLMYDLGLSMILLSGVLLAGFTATGVLSREIENKTALTVISKPIDRYTFLVGKFLGVALAITLAAWIWSVMFLLTARHEVMETAAHQYDLPVILFAALAVIASIVVAAWCNFFYGWVFSSTVTRLGAALLTVAYLVVLVVSKEWQVQSPLADLKVELLIALFFVVQVLWVLCAVAIAASTRLGQVMTLLVCFGVMLAGLLGDWLYGLPVETWWLRALAVIYYIITPNVQAFWISDALTQGTMVHMLETEPVAVTQFVGMVSGYAVLYIVAVLGLALALFQTREVS